MFSHWPIRKKLILGVVLLMLTVAALSISSFMGVYAFRSLAKSIRMRAPELQLGSKLAGDVSKLQVTYKLYHQSLVESDVFSYDEFPSERLAIDAFLNIDGILNTEYQMNLRSVAHSFEDYRSQLEENFEQDNYQQIRVRADEKAAVDEFHSTLSQIKQLSDDLDGFASQGLEEHLDRLGMLSTELPTYLHSRMYNFANEVKGQYRSWIAITCTMAIISALLLLLALRMFYYWVFRPLRVLVEGSRRVAAGDFAHQIQLDSSDEMAELAKDMNNMTNRFREIRDDLDSQVKQRTKEVVRSEQLASVGFLAAGVAHEINNPLASIALCAESLEDRVGDIMSVDDGVPDEELDDEVAVLREYLKMIQDEAFRCKEITERLLDFSRLGDVEKQSTDLTELAQSVIDTVKHLGRYKEKEIRFDHPAPVYAEVNSQEMKQVMLNLLTNALDSLERGGQVDVTIESCQNRAVMVVQDNGCGMTNEVRQHLFEPFFTRRRDGQGTGLGMSITYRIVNDHGGDISAHSDGPGAGSRITVSLPQVDHDEKQEQNKNRLAA